MRRRYGAKDNYRKFKGYANEVACWGRNEGLPLHRMYIEKRRQSAAEDANWFPVLNNNTSYASHVRFFCF